MKLIELRQKILLIRLDGQYWSLNGNRTYEPFALYCEVGLIYLLFCTVLTALQRRLEKKMPQY